MIKKIFAIYDEKSEAYLTPIFMDTIGQVIRQITDILDDETHQFSKHTSDFTLYTLGTYDDNSGVIEPDLKLISPLLEFKAKKLDNIVNINSQPGG